MIWRYTGTSIPEGEENLFSKATKSKTHAQPHAGCKTGKMYPQNISGFALTVEIRWQIGCKYHFLKTIRDVFDIT